MTGLPSIRCKPDLLAFEYGPVVGLTDRDGMRQVRADGTEFWSARDLMPFLGYTTWQRMSDAIDRARASASAQSQNVDALFSGTAKKTGGRSAEDVELTRIAAYLVAMNGDPSKPEVAAAQAFFAVKTRPRRPGVPASAHPTPQARSKPPAQA